MSGFPKVPEIRGDTDDEASIHLYSHIGPSKPLDRRVPSGLGIRTSYDRDILKILNEEDGNLSINGHEFSNFNDGFNKFRKLKTVENIDLEFDETSDEEYVNGEVNDEDDEEYSDDETILDDKDSEYNGDVPQKLGDPFDASPKPNDSLFQQLQRAKESEPKPKKARKVASSNPKLNLLTYIIVCVLSFAITIVVVWYFDRGYNTPNRPIESFKDITTRFQKIEKHLDQLNDVTINLSKNQELHSAKYESLEINLIKRFSGLNTKFEELAAKSQGNEKYDDLLLQFQDLKDRIENLELLSLNDNPELLEPKLNEITDKLNKLSELSTNLETVKSDILQKLVDSLPSHVPVYIKNNRVHYIPEFQLYLYNFVEKVYGEKIGNTTTSWNDFIKQNEIKLSNFISSKIKESPNIQTINKAALQDLVNSKLQENNKLIWRKFNNAIDKLNTVGTNSTTLGSIVTQTSSKILLDNLLEVFSKGTVKINYADYKLGTRILGFLTNNGHDFSNKSLPRKLFLGWYDYLTSNGLKNPKYWKFNANNVLIDGGDYWQCELNFCTFGLRLFNSVILTDLILKTPDSKLPEDFEAPLLVSIYIKPKNLLQKSQLVEYLDSFKVNFEPLNHKNKYLSKFVKVKEIGINPNKPINHIKFPISLVNMRIPIRDIYVELTSKQGTKTGLYNIKAYGISEYNSAKYSDEFDLLLNKMYDQQQEINDREEEERTAYSHHSDFDFDSHILGDDEILF